MNVKNNKVNRKFLIPVVLATQAIVSAFSPSSVSAYANSHFDSLNNLNTKSTERALGKKVSLWASTVLRESNGNFMGHRSHSSHSSHRSHASHVSHYSSAGGSGSSIGSGASISNPVGSTLGSSKISSGALTKGVTPSAMGCIDSGSLNRAELLLLEQTLSTQGFNPGGIDGQWTRTTLSAVNSYEHLWSLPLSTFTSINRATLVSLGISC